MNKIKMLIVGTALGTLISCTPNQKAYVKTAFDTISYLCILAHADLPSSKAVADACAVDQTLTPDIEKVVDDFKAKREQFAAEKMSAAHCGSK